MEVKDVNSTENSDVRMSLTNLRANALTNHETLILFEFCKWNIHEICSVLFFREMFFTNYSARTKVN